MLLRRIYIMALEDSERSVFRDIRKMGSKQSSLQDLELYARGYIQSGVDAHREEEADCWSEFLAWLCAQYPLYSNPKGWALTIIDEVGDGIPAYDKFRELLFQFLEEERPNWFIQYNLTKQPSGWFQGIPNDENYENISFEPVKDDIRIQRHIQLATKYTE